MVRSAINDSAIASIPLAANQAELSQVSSSQEQPDNMAMDIHEDSDAQETETDLVNVCCNLKSPFEEFNSDFLHT